ncbi:MAG: sodium:solute symporter, partial [Planctomycetes bacterium]|nr:sodium:solute symporter [Planctomycetota bacterium]
MKAPRTYGRHRLIPLLSPALLALAVLSPVSAREDDATAPSPLRWDRLPDLPGIGLGGPFAGTSAGALIVAGGANFPYGPPWGETPGAKVWYDRIHVLPGGATEWIGGFHLERPLAYGASVSDDGGVILIGGSDGERAYADVVRLAWNPEAKTIARTVLPPLPEPSTYLAAARIRDSIFVLPGHRTIDPTTTQRALWSLDLAAPETERRWIARPPCPGGPRIKAAAAAQSIGEAGPFLFIFGGEVPAGGADGRIERTYPRDAWRFDPGQTDPRRAWRAVAEMPRPAAAACAIAFGQGHILLASGDTGEHAGVPIEARPPFPREILAYHTITDTWVRAGEMPEGVVTTAAVEWEGKIVIPSGEIKPGIRTPHVQMAERHPAPAAFGAVHYGVLIIYLVALVAIGAYFSRREKGTQDFFLGGRRVPWWAAGLSIYATQLSAITYVALPAVAFAGDWTVFPSYVGILLMAPIVVAFYLPFFRRLNVTTAYEYLERRFHPSVRLIGSLSFVAFQLGRMAIVVYLPALALKTATGLDLYACILIIGILSTIYTALGGIEAVIWTDV